MLRRQVREQEEENRMSKGIAVRIILALATCSALWLVAAAPMRFG
jgi:hypothetical protein